MTPSPFRSWWKLGSSDFSAVLLPDTAPIVSLTTLPPLSTIHTVKRPAADVIYGQFPYAPDVSCSAPIGVQTNSPTVSGGPPYVSSGPVPVLLLSRK